MLRHRVSNPGQALAYLIDCTLATVVDLATKKSRSESEFIRQKSMAQIGIDWAVGFKVSLAETRAEGIVSAGQTVDEWAAHFDVKRAA
jgi:hypothetical protein